jgi:hypothetical protein
MRTASLYRIGEVDVGTGAATGAETGAVEAVEAIGVDGVPVAGPKNLCRLVCTEDEDDNEDDNDAVDAAAEGVAPPMRA